MHTRGRTRRPFLPPLPLVIAAGSAIAITLAFALAPALAQTPLTSTPIDPQTGELPSFAVLFLYSPYINGINAVLSVIALILFAYYMLTLNGRAMAPNDFIAELGKLISAQRYPQAVDLCRQNRHLLVASVSQRAIENVGREHSVILDMIDAEGRRRADVVWNRVSYLADIANVAPMLGLLGTVMGMIKAFFLLPSQSASINSQVLSQGIGEAMSTTMFGLIVAIVTVLFYALVKGRATKALAEVEQAVHNIADDLKRQDAAITVASASMDSNTASDNTGVYGFSDGKDKG